MKIKIVFILLISNFILNQGMAQVVYSPYSVFGVGRIENSGFGVNRALGGTGIALKSEGYLNTMNPASYQAIDSLRYLSEVGFYFNSSSFTSKDEVQRRNDGNIEYLALGFRITPKWAMSFGLTPFSRIDYVINSEAYLTGESSVYDMTYTGSGGINKFYVGNSYQLFKNFVVGMNASGIFGNVTLLEASSIGDENLDYSVEKLQTMNSFYFDFGLQYSFMMKQDRLTIGAIYGQKKELNTSVDINILWQGDELNLEDYEDVEPYEIPQKFGFGLAYKRMDNWEIGVDYEQHGWGSYDFSNPLTNSRNSERFSVGMQIFPQKKVDKRGLQNWAYRFGANYKKSSLIVSTEPINSYALVAGFGIPLKNSLSTLNLSFEYGQNGTTQHNLIKESYFQLNVSLGFQDIWFKRRKY